MLPEGLGNTDLVQEIMRTFNETNVLRRNRRLIFQQNARQYLEQIRFNQTESFDVLRRAVKDIECLQQTQLDFETARMPENLAIVHENRRFRERDQAQNGVENAEHYTNLKQFATGQRQFYVGMWLDVKDTIDQWLEAQVTNMRANQIFVHYNGWGARWDEWIDKDSPRIAVFRTYTV